jgi:hypothetical protein
VTAPPAAAPPAYAPGLRTALVLTGSGTAGAYHAGVLRAFTEAGVKIDLVAGTGMGAVSALFAAIDGGSALWGADGLWRSPATSRFYRVRAAVRIGAWALAASLSVVLLPLAALALGLLVYPLGFVMRLAGASAGSAIVRAYTAFVAATFDPAFLPSALPRAFLMAMVLFAGTLAVLALVVLARGGGRRRDDAPIWWRIVGAPLSSSAAGRAVTGALWQLLGGAAGARQPDRVELGRAYTDLLRENVGQPGFRELVLTVHDLDMRRDLVFALLGERTRRDFFRAGGPDRRIAEGFDLTGVGRDHLVGAVLASVTLPVATEVRLLEFPPESFWCGESHRVTSRPGALDRLLSELRLAGIEQVIIVSPFPELDGPHRLTVPRSDWRGRVSDYLAGAEAAAVRAATGSADRFRGVYLVTPSYNPVGPLDVRGCYDQRSDRVVTVAELVDRGYSDAYCEFIDPVVGASGERLTITGDAGNGVTEPGPEPMAMPRLGLVEAEEDATGDGPAEGPES